jgi:hypothetical protein
MSRFLASVGFLCALALSVSTGGAAPLALGENISTDRDKKSSSLTVDEALALCFPKCTITRGTQYLSPKEVKQVVKLSGSKSISRIAHPYQAHDAKGILVGTAWFDSHRVRSKRETLMIAADPAGKILRVEVLAFAEPRQYQPPAKWYGQLKGLVLSPELSLKGKVRNMAGATLTARATVQAARRALALQHVLGARNLPPADSAIPK